MDIKKDDLAYLQAIYSYIKSKDGASKEELLEYLGVSPSKLDELLDYFITNCKEDFVEKDDKYYIDRESLFDDEFIQLLNSLDIAEASYAFGLLKSLNTPLNGTLDTLQRIVNYSLASNQKTLIKEDEVELDIKKEKSKKKKKSHK
ncbi:MAG: hypothetical protein ACRQFF_13085, partial [Sphaerochaeta sp.]